MSRVSWPRLAALLFVMMFAAFLSVAGPVSPAWAAGNDDGVNDDGVIGDDVQWADLYHAAQGVDPAGERVPGQSFNFLQQNGGSTDLYVLAGQNDLTGVKIRYWDGAEHWIGLVKAATVDVAFRGQPGRPLDLWRATIRPCGGGTIYYRFEVTDGQDSDYLKAANGDITNGFGQNVRDALDDPDDYAFDAGEISGRCALWIDRDTLAWNLPPASHYALQYHPSGRIDNLASAPLLALAADGTVDGSQYPKNPNAGGKIRLKLPQGVSDATLKQILKGEVAVAGYDDAGKLVAATRVQAQGALDALYGAAAQQQALGVTYRNGIPTVRVWAPTARTVELRRFPSSTNPTYTTHPMKFDPVSGVWSVTGNASWDRQFYQFAVKTYIASEDRIVINVVDDPYAVSLSTDAAAPDDVRSQFVDLNAADLKPAGWDTLAKPPLAAPEDMSVYEVHVRDFSINDATVTDPAHRGGYLAFTYDGTSGRPLSDGMAHLKALQAAGLTTVHLLPVFDFASVDEKASERVQPNIAFDPAADRASVGPQAAAAVTRGRDGFNWGYDPYHYGAPEGSYSTNPDGVTRIREFRAMVQALNRNGLRVVMDMVYNHTAAAGQDDKSVLDKIVPVYYYRYTADGYPYTDSCCADTATEYDMMAKLMLDTVERFATAYKVDGFRFDLMNFHTRQNMLDVQSRLQALTPAANGVDGKEIYLYGEGWDFGSAVAKGLTTCPNCYAKQGNMAGTGIGVFNDKLRDAAHGGYSQDPVGIRKQGFINGLSYDWNGYCYDQRFQGDLHAAMGDVREGLKGEPDVFTDDPQETVNYIEKHDNETLFDQNAFKLPSGDGAGLPGWCGDASIPFTSMADRVAAQNLGASLVGLAQGIPFFQMGEDVLRSKSLDRNSFDSGDWFNRVDWSLQGNNFAKGLPPAWENSRRWPIMTPLLENTRLDAQPSDLEAAAAHLREILRIRKSSPLFRLRSETDVADRVFFYNSDNRQDALIVMALDDAAEPDLDPNYESILVFFNAGKTAQTFTVPGANGFTLHPVQADGEDADPVVQTATFDDAIDTFTIPARRTIVFVSQQPLPAASTLDFVGLMWPRGGAANLIDQGKFDPGGFDIFVQVFEPGVTDAAGQGAGVACTLRWGKYGAPWTDIQMGYNGDKGVNDEYKATLPKWAINALPPGDYGFNTYCRKTLEPGRAWKQDANDISGNQADDDQGDGLFTIIPAADSSAEPRNGVFVHLFEWRWNDIAKECKYLAQKGYAAVQVSPPNEHVIPVADMGGPDNDYPWWVRYQPVTHDVTKLDSRSGTRQEFQDMVTACNAAGVAIYVDAVFNHMAAYEDATPPESEGTAASVYNAFPAAERFYSTQYAASDFHPDCKLDSYQDRNQVQRCDLSGLPDLDTGSPHVQGEVHRYLQDLLDMGVKGFRIDGAKHMASQDIAAILKGLTMPGGGSPYIYQEVIDTNQSERIRDSEYTPAGDVIEFEYGMTVIGAKFNCGGHLSDLQNVPEYNNLLPSRFAVVFTDNHDNQRGHGAGGPCIVDHRDGQLYNLANIFMLAYPYGYPMITSSYYWSNDPNSQQGDSKGPPSADPPFTAGSGPNTRPVYGPDQAAGDAPENCSATYEDGKWVCEHRRTTIANMVGLRKVAGDAKVTNWQSIGGPASDHIAFGRGDRAFVAINRTASAATTTYTTGMRPGKYCDITAFDFKRATGQCVFPGSAMPAPADALIVVDANGRIVNKALAAMDAFAIHAAARVGD
jgi:pullulanase/glycogen debranching enzyme